MSCATIEARLEAFLEGRLAPAERREFDRHLRGCARCHDLVEMLRGDPPFPALEVPQGLAESVLRRTSGSTCGRCTELLGDLTDRRLDGVTEELVQQHLAGCAACAELARALARLSLELPRLAAIEPDTSFVGDVLAATRSLRPAARSRSASRLARAWSAWLARPRFAWEAAYVGAAIVWLCFMLPGSPLGGVPDRALALARTDWASLQSRGTAVAALQRRASNLGQQAWTATGVKGMQALAGAKDGLARRYRGTEQATRGLRQHGAELGGALLDLDLQGSTGALRDIGDEAGTIWERLRQPSEGPVDLEPESEQRRQT